MRHVAVVILSLVLAASAGATQPPRPGTDEGTNALATRGIDISRFTYRRALQPLVESVLRNQRLALAGQLGVNADAMELGPTAVTGKRAIPVLLVKYHDTGVDPYASTNLARELFSEEWPDGCNAKGTCTGTMTQYYREISYGQFTVMGEVREWTTLREAAAHYQGEDYLGTDGTIKHCNGLCDSSNVGELIQEAVTANSTIEWERFDNDGPDGRPNSGDDDGYVDFVAFVHPERGGECNDGNRAIWSHRFNLSNLTGSDLATSRIGISGDPIRIDDYVIMPAFACDATTMIQIGVFAHEFGHAFGLPDLYDTSGKGSGLGNWCLMASGSWGGDGDSPERPSHMSPWAKSYLGWISLQPILGDMSVSLEAIESTPRALRIPISTTQYYIVSNERRRGFDSRLPADGLAIWKVNQTALDAGMRNNTVNAKANKGIELIEADGLQQLNAHTFRGGPGDVFPVSRITPGGAITTRSFDNSSRPTSIGNTAICDIGDPNDPMDSRISVRSGRCNNVPAAPELIVDPAAPASTSLREILGAAPGAFSNKGEVRIAGTITNAGSNLFKRADRKFVLRDFQGNEIEVKLSVPFEGALPQMTQSHAMPPTAADVLGQSVELTGVLEHSAQGTWILKTTKAKVMGNAGGH